MDYYDVTVAWKDNKADVPGGVLEAKATLHIQGSSADGAVENALFYLERHVPWHEVNVEGVTKA